MERKARLEDTNTHQWVAYLYFVYGSRTHHSERTTGKYAHLNVVNEKLYRSDAIANQLIEQFCRAQDLARFAKYSVCKLVVCCATILMRFWYLLSTNDLSVLRTPMLMPITFDDSRNSAA